MTTVNWRRLVGGSAFAAVVFLAVFVAMRVWAVAA